MFKRLFVLLGLTILLLGAYAYFSPTTAQASGGGMKQLATCNPYGDCKACSTCSSCGHCAKGGGKCSVCR